jgi:hypothetical protein
MAQSSKFGVKKLIKGVGSLGIFDTIRDSQVRVIVENAGSLNTLAVYGKIQGQNTYQLIDTVVGSQSKLIDVTLFDFLDLELITYDTLSNYVDIAGSGFVSSGGGGNVTGVVSVSNFPATQNVIGTVTALGPLTDAELRATPVQSTLKSSTGVELGINPDGSIDVTDGLKAGGVYGSVTMTSANTAYEVKFGSSPLVRRKAVHVTLMSSGIYWGLDSSVTTSTGTPTAMGQSLVFTADPTGAFTIFLVCANAGATFRIVEIP